MTVCSGIGAPEIAAPWIKWRYQSEIEPFPSAVLAHRFPDAVNLGDMTKFEEWLNATVNVLVGGTPCQSFSVAGLRKGLDDPRGNLMLTYLAIARRYQPEWVVWENVPGVLSSNGGRDFGAFLRGLGECGYGFAYRVLDAQFVRTSDFPRAVPQRRRRVFVVGYLGDWRRAAAVLFDAESMSGNPPPRREAGQRPAPTISARPTGGGGLGTDFDCDGGLIAADCAPTLNAHFGDKMGLENQHINQGGACSLPPVSMSLNAHGARLDAESETLLPTTGGGFDVAVAIQERAVSENLQNGPQGSGIRDDGVAYTLEARNKVQAVAFHNRQDPDVSGDVTHPLGARDNGMAVAFSSKDYGGDAMEGVSPTLRAGGHDGSHANAGVPPAVAWALRASSVPLHVLFDIGVKLLTAKGNSDADAEEARPGEALRALRGAYGEKAFYEWRAGISAALRAAEILRSEVHGGGVRRTPIGHERMVDDPLSRPENGSEGAVQQVRKAERTRRSPQGSRPYEQRPGELRADMPKLSQPGASAEATLQDMWRSDEGARLLQQASDTLAQVWRPAGDQDTAAEEMHSLRIARALQIAVREALHAGKKSRDFASLTDESGPASRKGGHGVYAVRRLTPRLRECERLQGFPDDWTAIPWRNKPPENCPDGPRYKALGNSIAINCLELIFERIRWIERKYPARMEVAE